jgi:polysaccharide pyruvyl transferase WcaK-like protein
VRVLLGGVPFGKNNVGDEAILEGVVGLLREICPGVSLTVSTADPVTSDKLGVAVVPLLGFDEQDPQRIREAMARHDVFVWSGATGLSDYPEVSARLLELAQQCGCKTALLSVGMNRELNPALYRVLPGRRRRVLKLLDALTGERLDAVALEERRRRARALRHLRRALGKADLVSVRDAPSLTELRRAGVRGDVLVGADSALRLTPTPWQKLPLAPGARAALESSDTRIGLCISTQGQVVKAGGDEAASEVEAWAALLDRLTDRERTRVVFIPMNPITDAGLARTIVDKMRNPTRVEVLEGRLEPADVVAVAEKLDAVISSRLHLLILASIAAVPLIGLGNGTKVDNFLRDFGLEPACHVLGMDYDRLYDETLRMVAEKPAFQARARQVHASALARIEALKQPLARIVCP